MFSIGHTLHQARLPSSVGPSVKRVWVWSSGLGLVEYHVAGKRNRGSCAPRPHHQRRNKARLVQHLCESEQGHLVATACYTGGGAVTALPALHADMCTSNQVHLTDITLYQHTMLHSAMTDEVPLSLSQVGTWVCQTMPSLNRGGGGGRYTSRLAW